MVFLLPIQRSTVTWYREVDLFFLLFLEVFEPKLFTGKFSKFVSPIDYLKFKYPLVIYRLIGK